MRCEAWAGALSWWSCQSPVAHSCGLLNHPNSVHGVMFKLNAKFDSLLYSLSHFECDGHTVHMLTPWCVPPPLTSTVKSTLFTHEHSSPLSVATKITLMLYSSHCINNGWTFCGQTWYMLSPRDPSKIERYIQTKNKGIKKDISCHWKGKKSWGSNICIQKIHIINKRKKQTKYNQSHLS